VADPPLRLQHQFGRLFVHVPHRRLAVNFTPSSADRLLPRAPAAPHTLRWHRLLRSSTGSTVPFVPLFTSRRWRPSSTNPFLTSLKHLPPSRLLPPGSSNPSLERHRGAPIARYQVRLQLSSSRPHTTISSYHSWSGRSVFSSSWYPCSVLLLFLLSDLDVMPPVVA
jgi:hypothetical protein